MKYHINLLPWRLKQHRQQSKILLWKLCGLIFGIIIFSIGLHYFNRQISARLTEKQADLQQTDSALTQTERQIVKLRNNYGKQENQTPLTTEKVINILGILSGLPFRQGELDTLILNSKQIELAGTTENQQEFEQLNRFLSENEMFRQVSLSHFIPHQSGSLQFRFILNLAEE